MSEELQGQLDNAEYAIYNLERTIQNLEDDVEATLSERNQAQDDLEDTTADLDKANDRIVELEQAIKNFESIVDSTEALVTCLLDDEWRYIISNECAYCSHIQPRVGHLHQNWCIFALAQQLLRDIG